MSNGRMNGEREHGSSYATYDHHLDPRSARVPPPQQQQQQQQQYPYEGQPLLQKNYPSAHHQDVGYWDDEEESEAERQEACRGMTLIAVFLFTAIMGLRYLTAGLTQHQFSNPTKSSPSTGTGTAIPASEKQKQQPPQQEQQQQQQQQDVFSNSCPNGMAFCEAPAKHQVSTTKKGFPSFWNYAPGGPMNVTYDKRSFLINGDRALFLSGSAHPTRTTKETWELALDQAVHHGLNMVTIYVFWAEHQPFPDQEIDWTLPGGQGPNCDLTFNAPSYCGWSLADAIRSAASRGLFVHARIGPYVCAEYNYGGIPEWVALHQPNIAMRRLNPKWLEAMQAYVKSTVQYLQQNRLFAYQGGPIVMAQIENELGEEDDTNNIPMMDDDIPALDAPAPAASVSEDSSSRKLILEDDEASGKTVNVQDYADWCGSLVQQLAPKVVWTMCNGLTANNTILTCNGDCSTSWLENYGAGSGRIQVDQPAIWTEDEGGFQLWGEDSSAPTDYFWGRTARAMAYDTLRWFARGGSHLNYYMWWGGYNRRRASAAGIMNAYATDAPVCPSGHPREPKFSHFQALHKAIHHIAPILLSSPSAMKHSIDVQEMNNESEWIYSGKQRMFAYHSSDQHNHKPQSEIIFVENDSRDTVVVKIPLKQSEDEETMVLTMNPQSAVLLVDGTVKFDSFSIDGAAMSYKREIKPAPVNILGWASCSEPIGPSKREKSLTLNNTKPKEQTALNIDARVYSDYAWYESHLDMDESLDDATIFVESQIGSAMVLFIDGEYIGEAFTQQHAEGNITFQFPVGHLRHGRHKLAFLSESLGYHNLIGRWGAKTGAKIKGITGDVLVASRSNSNISMVDGRAWKSHPGLHGHERAYCRDVASDRNNTLPRPTWSSAMFNTPDYDPTTHALYLNITKGRGHLWLNGHDLGRFWNITRGDTKKYSQQYYFLPPDLLEADGSVNKIVFFDALGSNLRTSTNLILSYLKRTDAPNFKDQVDFDGACI